MPIDSNLIAVKLKDFYCDFYRNLGVQSCAESISIHSVLIESITDIPFESTQKRQPSMFIDGTKVGYSLQLNVKGISEDLGFRILVEPGGVGMTLPEQINFSLSKLDIIFATLGWQHLAKDINRIIASVYPKNPVALNNWIGGMWLGADIKQSYSDLKLYMNLRNGDIASRWQRIADVFAPYAAQEIKPLFCQTLEESIKSGGIPVGLGVVIRNGKLLGFRIYISLENPTTSIIIQAIPVNIIHDGKFRNKLEELEAILNNFEGHSVTIGYDFILHEKLILPEVYRFKADLCFNKFINNKKDLIASWVRDNFNIYVYNQFNSFFSLLDQRFGGNDIDYISLGLKGNKESQITWYTKPHGISQQDTTTHKSS